MEATCWSPSFHSRVWAYILVGVHVMFDRLAERVSAHIGRHALWYDQCVSRLLAGHLDTALMLAESHCLGTRRECMCAGARMVVDPNALEIASCDTCMYSFQRPCSIGGVGYHTFSRKLKMWRWGTHGRRSERV